MEQLNQQDLWLILLLTLWQAPWKGWALWKAAKLNDKKWFIALLVIQTIAVMDIFYIFVFSKRKASETK